VLPLHEAIEVFGRGFCATRSFTHPYQLSQVERLWVMGDGPRRSGDYRVQEVLIHGVTPDEAVSTIRRQVSGRFFACVIEPLHAPLEELKAAYKEHGFRLLRREPMMARRLDDVPALDGPCEVRRVLDGVDAELVRLAAGGSQIPKGELREDSSIRLYAAFEGGRAVGFVRSIQATPRATWVSNMVVLPEWRRRGIARSIMSQMLADDRALGGEYSVLLASHVGSKLYATLGYEQIGLLQLFAPIRGKW
jgi:GNAT superfamily N-acetyltransferase